jgi:hypothetical protein
MPNTFKVTFGGWYQRTTLHLSEIYEFFLSANSYLPLDRENLLKLHRALNLQKVAREFDYLEYVSAVTKDGIKIRYFEDGLYILEAESKDVKKMAAALEQYFWNKLTPAINYIFSLGAPTPKILANIITTHPTVVSFFDAKFNNYKFDEKTYGVVYSKISSENLAVYKTKDYIFIVSKEPGFFPVATLVEMQIFFREFKDQMEKYLNIHRKIWEEIAKIKERRYLTAKEVPHLRTKLDGYQGTISLISNRINQMGSYVGTRKSISSQSGVDVHLDSLFQYRFEVLKDTLDYIKEIWKMTSDYVNSSIQVIVEIQSAATNKSIQSLTLITALGVLSTMVAFLSRDSFPKVTAVGFLSLVIILLIGWLANLVYQSYLSNRKQKLKFTERDGRI